MKNGATCPFPTEQNNENLIFDSIGTLLSNVFTYARNEYNFKTCVGTETPLTKPPSDDGSHTHTAYDYYKAMFKRIEVTYPIDYYWLWTPEGWQWKDVKVTDPIVQQAVADMKEAYRAIHDTNVSFRLATCGWTLGLFVGYLCFSIE